MKPYDFVSIQQVKVDLRIDNDDEDADIGLKISAASRSLAVYIQLPDAFQDSSGAIPLDSSGDPIVDEDVQQATLILVGIMYRDRDGTEMEKWQQGYLPFAVTSFVYHRRVPSMS
jgi:hypothetical protein